MNNLKYIIIAFAFIGFLSSCEDIIVLDLKDTEPRSIIEAKIDASSGEATVLLSTSNGFYEDNDLHTIDNASISLITPDNSTLNFDNEGLGVYSLSGLVIQSGAEYKLEITNGEELYSAVTIAPFPVEVLNADTTKVFPPFGDGIEFFYQILGSWNDPVNQPNYYRLQSYIDGKINSGNIQVYKDGDSDGTTIFQPVMAFFEVETLVTFELLSVDRSYYNYFSQLAANQSQGTSGSVPFNPQGNFEGNALGYFGITFSSQVEIQL